MSLDISISVAGLVVGFIVGLTGMGGGALMTPILVLLFGVQPLAAVSSDLVASMVMKPVGGGVHLRHGTVHRGLVTWLVLGSVPSAFAGVLLLKVLGQGQEIEHVVKSALGVALLVAALALALKGILRRRAALADPNRPLDVRKLATVSIGIIGGLVVGMTSVGSGSLMMLMLLLVYPHLSLSHLVGTDLVQAVPLVASASLAHLLFGDFQLGLTASILVGALPGVYMGARLSARAPEHLIRPALIVVLLASSMKLLGASNMVMMWGSAALVAGGIVAGILSMRRHRAAEPVARAEPAVRAEPVMVEVSATPATPR